MRMRMRTRTRSLLLTGGCGLSLNSELVASAGLSDQWTSGDPPVSVSPTLGLQTPVSTADVVWRCWRSKLMLTERAFYRQAEPLSLQPQTPLFNVS